MVLFSGKKKKITQPLGDDTAMRIITGDKSRDVSYRELLLSTNFTLEALISLLVRKNIIQPEELLEEIETIRKSHGESLQGGDDDHQTSTSS